MKNVTQSKIPWIDYLALTFGAALMAIGIGVFLVDAQVVPGGVSGLSISIYFLSNHKIPIGLLMWVFNVPLFIWGIKELGKSFAFRTFFSFSVNSIFIDLFRGDIPGLRWFRLQDMSSIVYLFKHDFFFLIMIGSVLLGVGLGIIFKFKGTTAGSDIVAAILNKHYGWKPGQAIMLTDFFVITFAGLIIGLKGLSPEKPALVLTIYALFSLYLSSKIIDFIIDGFDYARMAMIISPKNTEIGEMILKELSRGATGLKARGLYQKNDGEVLMTVVPVKQIASLTEKVKEIDPDAFIVVSNVHEVLGNGFRSRF